MMDESRLKEDMLVRDGYVLVRHKERVMERQK
jgi:hypothetical protein